MKKPTLTTREVRFVAGNVAVEYRAVGDKTPVAFTGNAIVCGSRSRNLGGFYEVIDPSALNEADMSDVVGLFNHNNDILLGRNTSATLTLSRTEGGGLAYRIAYDPLDTDHVRVMRKIERGDVVGSSFAFRVPEGGDTWVKEEGDADCYLRTVYKISRVSDVGPVTSPAYADSTAAKRSLGQFKEAQTPENSPEIAPETRTHAVEIDLLPDGTLAGTLIPDRASAPSLAMRRHQLAQYSR